jgi:hypothetical protein
MVRASRSLVVSGAVLAGLFVIGACSDDDNNEIELAIAEHARILCDKLFSCCTDAELADLAFVDEKSPPTRDGCIELHKKTGASWIPLTRSEESAGRLAIDLGESEACAEETRGLDCATFHARLVRIHLADAFSLCNSAVVKASAANGSACRIYFGCQSGFCDLPPGSEGKDAGSEAIGTCKPPPGPDQACPSEECAEGLRCHPETAKCTPLLGPGGTCVADDECGSGACKGGKCVSPGRCGG